MEAALARKPEEKKKSQAAPESFPEPNLSPEAEIGAPAGMPLFLQRLAVSSASPALIQRQIEEEEEIEEPLEQPEEELLQTKLTVGQPGDRYEQEADRVATQMIGQFVTTNPIKAPAPPTTQGTAQRQEKDDELAMAQPVKTVQGQDEADAMREGDENSSRVYVGGAEKGVYFSYTSTHALRTRPKEGVDHVRTPAYSQHTARSSGFSERQHSSRAPDRDARSHHRVNPVWQQLTLGPSAAASAGPPRERASARRHNPVVQRMCTGCENDEETPIQRQEEEAEEAVQTKLTVGPADDQFEREADGVADRVMRMSTGSETDEFANPAQSGSRDAGTVRRKRGANGATPGLSARVTRAISTPGTGSPISDHVRSRVEPVLGADLSHVRVHDNAAARDAAGNVNAAAFTHKNHIYLGQGHSGADLSLMAHEATHVVQQGAVGPRLQRDATNESITAAYADGLSDEALVEEMVTLADLLGTQSSEFDISYHENLLVLKKEYFTRTISAGSRTPEQFQKGAPCYNRETEPWTMVVDSHVHYEPFGLGSVPTEELYDFFHRTDVEFTSALGIGQILDPTSGCRHYLQCPWVWVRPSMRNDVINAWNLLGFDTGDVNTIISRAGPDLAQPEGVMWRIEILDAFFPPDTFKGIGEVNLVKQALEQNWVSPVPVEAIPKWSEFMAFLRERKMPILIHADLGRDPMPGDAGLAPSWPMDVRGHDHDDNFHVPGCEGHACHDYGPGSSRDFPLYSPLLSEPVLPDTSDSRVRYLPLLEAVLEEYPDNKIVWMHMGLSYQLLTIDPDFHIGIMKRLLKTYDNLMLDISWKVLFEHYFDPKLHPEKRKKYVAFINDFPARFITGTDFIADELQSFKDYQKLVWVNSDILRSLEDKAFRMIALGENYFRLYRLPNVAPSLCAYSMSRDEMVDWVDRQVAGVSRQ